MFKPFCFQHVICTGADEATGGRQSSLGRDASKVPLMQTADCYVSTPYKCMWCKTRYTKQEVDAIMKEVDLNGDGRSLCCGLQLVSA